MASIIDNRGYNQGFAPSAALTVRTERRVRAILAEMDPQTPCRSVLELGCGTGELSYRLATLTAAHVLGVDCCASFIHTAQEQYRLPNLTFAALDVREDDLGRRAGGPVDYIVGNGILHHLHSQLPELLPRLRKMLAPRGRLIFWEPNLQNPYIFLIFRIQALRRWARLEPGEMAFTRGELEGVLRRAGFSAPRVACRDFLLPNTPAALIRAVVRIGAVAERVPLVSHLAQSLFVSAGNDGEFVHD